MDEKLLETIRNSPDDPSTYGVVADALIEQGDPRGELMQVQLQLEDDGLDAGRRDELVAREKSLIADHAEALLGALAEPLCGSQRDDSDYNFQRFAFSRGFLHSIETSELSVALTKALRESGETKFLRRLRVDETEYIEEEADIDGEELDEDTSLVSYLPWERMSELRELQVGYVGDDDNTHLDGEELASELGALKMLESLEIGALRVPTGSVFRLELPHLRKLTLYHCYDYDLAALASNASMKKLEELRCRPHGLEPGDDNPYIRLDGLRALLASPHIKKLRVLELRASDIGDEGVKLLLDSGLVGQLSVLDLHYGEISDEGARLFAAHADTKKLDKLDISGNALTDAGLAALTDAGVKFVSTEQFTLNDEREYLWYGCPE